MLRARHLIPALLALTACQTVGPRSLQYGRGQYNVAIQRTNGEQILLNLVRLRYRDAPLFLDVTSISSSLSLELGSEVGGVAGPVAAGGGVVTPSGRVNYTERPTITYAPLQGQRFGQQFLSPLDLRGLLLLYHSGWSIDRIFKVFLQHLGPLPNAPRASGPTPGEEPLYRDFFRACELLRKLWSVGHVDLAYSEYGQQPVILLRIDPTLAASAEVAEVARLLGLPAPTTTILLSDAARPGDPNVVPIVPRSLLGGMYYVSQGVEPPAADARAGRVTVTRSLDGHTFDWRRITGNILRVRSSSRRPHRPYISVYYRDRYWYIDDADLDSKSTFSLLSQTLELQSSELKQTTPVLTLPISAE
jgi:hypothetical protein